MTPSEIEEKFETVRTKAAQGQLVIFRMDGRFLLLPALQRSSVRPEMLAAVEQILPSAIKRNVAVIGNTTWAMAPAPDLKAANHAVPFFGLLMGLSSIGHSVWMFDGTADLINAGCREADVLILDSARLQTLPTSWRAEAVQTMRNPQILVHDRATYALL